MREIIFYIKGFAMERDGKHSRSKYKDIPIESKKKLLPGKKIVNYFLKWLVLVLAAATCGYAFITFCFQTVTVVGPSMQETLYDGQEVIVDKLKYKIGDVKRYDVIAYSKLDSNGYYDIKRVIGLPGETILIKNGAVYIDDNLLERLPFDEEILISGVVQEPYTLKKEEYFVLGDNVNNSEDSRFTNIGNVQKSEILGKVIFIIDPVRKKVK